MDAREDRRMQLATAAVVAVLVAFQLWYVGSERLDLSPEEAQYWNWSRRLDWGYSTKGPVVAWLIAASTRPGGDTPFFVRLPAILLALGTASLLIVLARRLAGGARAGLLTVLVVSATPMFVAGSMLMTTDAPWAFFWALALYGTHRAVGEPGRVAGWVIAGTALGLGVLTKYPMLLFLPCASVWAALSPAARTAFLRREAAIAPGLAALLATPLLIWNLQHDGAHIRHVLEQTGITGGAPFEPLKTLSNFVGSQIGVLSPLILVLALAALWRNGIEARRSGSDTDAFLFAFSVPVLAFFLAWSVGRKVQANWAAAGWVTAFVSLARSWDASWRASAGSTRLRFARPAVALGLGWAISLVALFPDLPPALGMAYPPRIHPANRELRGWEELGERVGAIRARAAAGGRELFLMSERYQTASELAFYVPGRPRTYNVDLGRRPNQFDLWGGLDELRGRDGLYVQRGPWDAHPAVAAACERIERVATHELRVRGLVVESHSIHRCDGFRGLDANAR